MEKTKTGLPLVSHAQEILQLELEKLVIAQNKFLLQQQKKEKTTWTLSVVVQT